MHRFLKQFESRSHAATQSGDNPKPVEQANGLLKPHLQIVPSASYLQANSKKTLGSIYHVLIDMLVKYLITYLLIMTTWNITWTKQR